jgi:hypothetical protein
MRRLKSKEDERRKLFEMGQPYLRSKRQVSRFALFLLFFSFCVLVAKPVFAQGITDQSISLFVETELRHEKGFSSHRTDAETKEGIVTLSGTARNVLAKERATEIARGVKGVRGVINHLSIPLCRVPIIKF